VSDTVEQQSDGFETVTLRIRSKLLDEALQFAGIQKMTGHFYPEHDPMQALALIVLMRSGRIKKS
jgi:hypothetical protein